MPRPAALPFVQRGPTDDLPNIEAPLEDICRELALYLSSEDPLKLKPMLLLGDPGIGKARFARKLARLLRTGYSFVGVSSPTAGWILSSAPTQLKNAGPGKVFGVLVDADGPPHTASGIYPELRDEHGWD